MVIELEESVMKIEFFNKKTGEVIKNTDDYYFIMNGEVFIDSEVTYESQCAVIGFEDCIKKMPGIGWRLTTA